MPAITLGYSQIKEQIRIIRRRRNWWTVQQAVYLCGGAILLGVALLIILAARGERLAFTIAFWAMLASILLCASAAAGSIWRRWIRAAETPRWIDRVAHLDDRLATLVAHQGASRPPRMMAPLVSQLFALRHRWAPTTLVPRRVPRSIYFFVTTLIALIATSFLERPPATPQRFPHAKTAAQHPNAPPDETGGDARRLHAHQAGSAKGMQEGGAGEGGEGAFDHPQRGSRAQARNDARGAPGPGSHARGSKNDGRSNGPTGMHATAERETVSPALPDRLQDMIRQALRQPPLDGKPTRSGTERLQAERGEPREQKGGSEDQPERHAWADARADRDQRQEPANAGTTPPQQRDPEGGRGSNSGGGGRQGTSGIYGTQASAIPQDNTAKKFELTLTLLGQSSRATMEPQKSRRGGMGDLGVPGEQPAANVALNPNQRADEPLVRGEIPAEYETTIKRIFSRSE